MSKNNGETVLGQFIGKCNKCGKTTKLNVNPKLNEEPKFCIMCGAVITYLNNNLLTESKEV